MICLRRYLAERQKTEVADQPGLNKHLLGTYQAGWVAKKSKNGGGRNVEVSEFESGPTETQCDV